MFRFENGYAWYGLLGVLLLLLLYRYSKILLRKRLSQFGTSDAANLLSSGNEQPKGRYILLGIGLIFLIVALANPQLGTKSETIKAERTDIFILLDISASMDTRDVSPSRLERAKKWLSELIVKRKGDRIGLILFAGSAYLQMPLTVDYAAAMMFIQNASTQLAGSQGTAIGEAIKLAVTSKKQDTPGMMLIISDGEDHDGEAIEQAELAMEEGWVVSTISVGTPSGGPVPDEAGMPGDYKEDNSGNQVISVPNRKLMAEIAKTAEGEAFHSDLNDEDLLQALDAHIDTMKTREMEVRSYADYQSYFQYFLLPGLVLLLFIYVKWYA